MALSVDYGLGEAGADLLLNAIFRGTLGTPPTSLWFSLGTGASIAAVTEVAGMVRAEARINRGDITCGTSKFENGGTDTEVWLRKPTIGFPPTSLGVTSGDQLWVMAFGSSAGSDLLFLARSVDTGSGIVRFWWGGACTDFGGARFSAMGEFCHVLPFSILTDWLFRGFDSFNTRYALGTNPNTYLRYGAYINGIYMPAFAAARSTATWSAPADAGLGGRERKIVNLVTFTFGPRPATGTWTAGMTNLEVFLSTSTTTTRIMRLSRNYVPTILSGDYISFAPGDFELVLG